VKMDDMQFPATTQCSLWLVTALALRAEELNAHPEVRTGVTDNVVLLTPPPNVPLSIENAPLPAHSCLFNPDSQQPDIEFIG
jgi:hypothetical protein